MDMKKFLLAAVLTLGASSAYAAESIKATVGHMCCGACKNAASTGVKTLDWVDTVAIDGDVVTVTAKADQKADLVSLSAALRKSGFPAREVTTSGPVTFTVAHLCCPGCVNDLKTKLGNIQTMRLALDKDKIVVDATAKTVTLQPTAGQSFNVVALLAQMERAGFSPSKGSLTAAATTASSAR
jgi:copper chaperone CopZ